MSVNPSEVEVAFKVDDKAIQRLKTAVGALLAGAECPSCGELLGYDGEDATDTGVEWYLDEGDDTLSETNTVAILVYHECKRSSPTRSWLRLEADVHMETALVEGDDG